MLLIDIYSCVSVKKYLLHADVAGLQLFQSSVERKVKDYANSGPDAVGSTTRYSLMSIQLYTHICMVYTSSSMAELHS